MKSYEKLLLNNRSWSERKRTADPEFFERLAQTQKPEFLWICCSDSRVPVEIIVNANPGEIFIHRNIANQMVATDTNSLRVLLYAVAVLAVKHIIVCGHNNCGGVIAVLAQQTPHLVITNKWLMHIKQTYRLHKQEIDSIDSETGQVNRLVELNVIDQAKIIAHTSFIRAAGITTSSPLFMAGSTVWTTVCSSHWLLLLPIRSLKLFTSTTFKLPFKFYSN